MDIGPISSLSASSPHNKGPRPLKENSAMATQTQAKIVIKGQNEVKDAVRGASNDLMSLTQTIQKVGNAFRSAFTVTAVIGAVKQLGSAIGTMVTEDFGEANRAYAQLAMALGDSTAYDEVVANIDRLSKQTLAANGDIEAMVAELAALGKSADEINAISDASVALSNVTGKDLSSSMTIMLATLNGTTTQLKRMGIDLGDLTEEELKSGAAIEIVNDRFGRYSEMLAETDLNQSLKNMSETWGDIKEKIGGVVSYNFGPLLRQLDAGFEAFGQNVNSVTTYVGAVIANLPEVFSLAMDTVGKVIARTFRWETIKTIVVDMVKNIGSLLAALFEGMLKAIPDFLKTAGAGIVEWIAYIALNLKMEIKKAVTDAVNSLGEWLSGTWFGRLFGLGDGMAAFSFDMSADEAAAAELKRSYQEAFGGFGDVFSEHIGNAVDAVKESGQGFADTFTGLYGDIMTDYSSQLSQIIGPELAEIRSAADAADQSAILEQIAANTAKTGTSPTASSDEGSTDESITSSISALVSTVEDEGGSLEDALQAIIDEYSSAMNDIVIPGFERVDDTLKSTDATSTLSQIEENTRDDGSDAAATGYRSLGDRLLESAESSVSSIFSRLTESARSSANPFIAIIGTVISEAAGPVIDAISPLIGAIDGLADPVQVLARIITGIVNILAPAVQTVIQPLLDVTTYLGESIGRLFLPILDPLCAAFNLLGQILMTAVVPVFQTLAPIFEVLGLVVTTLNPILILLAKAFTILMSPVQFIADLFSWLGNWVRYLGDCIYVATWNLTHWFNRKSYGSSPGGFSSDAFSGLQGRLDAIDELAAGTSHGASDSVSTGTSLASASYQGGTTVTINIWQQAPVVGDGGMAAFARMIRREFEALDHYGVTT